MSNTVIQLKYSDATSVPSSLNTAEPAYSNVSNKLYIGQSDGSVVAIGGKYYTGLIDAATSANTASAIVKRGSDGGFSASYVNADLHGTADRATVLQNARNFGIDGDDVIATNIGFDGSGSVLLQGNLKTTGVTAGVYGGSSAIPVFTVDTKGRITAASNTSISVPTTMTFAGDSGTGTLSLTGDTFTINGRDGLTSVAVDANNTVFLDVDNTVLRTTGNQTVTGDFAVTGNLTVTGTQTIVNTTTVQSGDSLIKLAANNTVGDVVDIGFYGSSNTGSSVQYHGLIREGSGGSNAGAFYLFKNLATDPTGNVISYAGLTKGTLYADLAGSTGLPVSTGISGLGTGVATFLATPTSANFASALTDETGSGSVVFSNTPTLVTPVLGAATGTSLNVSSGLVSQGAWGGTFSDGIVVDYATGQGRISVGSSDGIGFYAGGVATTPLMNLSSSGVITGATWQGSTVGVSYGGTGATSFTTGQSIVYDGSKLASRANVSQTVTGGLSTANTISSITFDAVTGGVTAYTGSAIAIAASQVTSGTLGVVRGGTGAASFTTKGVIVSDSSSTTGALSALTSSTEGHVLQINASGVPTFGYLNGGSF